MVVGLHQSAKWLQLRAHTEAEEEEESGDEGEESEEQIASSEGPRDGLWDVKVSIRVLMTVHCAVIVLRLDRRMCVRMWDYTYVRHVGTWKVLLIVGRNENVTNDRIIDFSDDNYVTIIY